MERRTKIVELDTSQVESVIAANLPGEKLQGFHLLHGGRANTNYAVETSADGETHQHVLRLYVRDAATCAKEVSLAGMLTGLPVPRLLAHGRVPGVAHPYAVWEFVPGRTLAECAKQNAVPDQTAFNIGRVLARIRQRGFATGGDIKGSDAGPVVEPWSFGENALEGFVRWCLFESPAGERLGSAIRDRLWQAVQTHESVDSPPVLVHGDFNPTNILLDADGQVTGVLDWEFAHAGDPIADIANLLRQRSEYTLPPDFAEHLQQGLTDAGIELATDWRAQAAFADLSSALDFLSSVEDKPETHAAAKRQIEQYLTMG